MLPFVLPTVLLAGFAVYISYQQYRTSRERFKLDLFEKRFQVFSGARRLLSEVVREGNIELEALFEYRVATSEASFLFGDDIADHLAEIDRRAVRLHTTYKKLGSLPVGAERSEVAAENSLELEWLANQLPELKMRFA